MDTENIKFCFIDKNHQPTESEYGTALGPSLRWWKIIKEWFNLNYQEVATEWKFYSASTGWTLVFKHNDRIVFYFYPLENKFCILFMYNDRAIFEARRSSALPPYIISAITTAMRVTDGRAFFIEVLTQNDVMIIQRLIKIKMASAEL